MIYDACIFDLDGTLINTQVVDYAIQRDLLASFGYELTPQVYASAFGMTRPHMVDTFLSHVTNPPSTAQYLATYAPLLETAVHEREDLLVPGAEALCQHLYLQGVPLALVTSSPRSILPHISAMERLLPLFRVVVTADDVSTHKPEPEPYLKAKDLLQTERPFVFEDSLQGALAANRANLPFAIHKHAANDHAARIAPTMRKFQFIFEDYHDPRIERLYSTTTPLP